MPWHYHDPFFQRTPLVYALNLDLYYKDRDVKELSLEYYAGIGLPVEWADATDPFFSPANNPKYLFQKLYWWVVQ